MSNQWTKITFERFIEVVTQVGLIIEQVDNECIEDKSFKKEFIEYLQERYKYSTAINYASCIEQIQKHHNENENDNLSFFYCNQEEIVRIKNIMPDYVYGKYDDGSPQSNARRTAFRAFVAFLDYKFPKPSRPKAILIKKNK